MKGSCVALAGGALRDRRLKSGPLPGHGNRWLAHWLISWLVFTPNKILHSVDPHP